MEFIQLWELQKRPKYAVFGLPPIYLVIHPHHSKTKQKQKNLGITVSSLKTLEDFGGKAEEDLSPFCCYNPP